MMTADAGDSIRSGPQIALAGPGAREETPALPRVTPTHRSRVLRQMQRPAKATEKASVQEHSPRAGGSRASTGRAPRKLLENTVTMFAMDADSPKFTENNGRNSDKRLANLRPFPKGVSGNPGGRPRGAREFAELIAQETRSGAELVEYALKVLRSKRGKAKQWAVEYLTERMLGRAPQSIELTGKDGGPIEHSDVRERLVARFRSIFGQELSEPGSPSVSGKSEAERLLASLEAEAQISALEVTTRSQG